MWTPPYYICSYMSYALAVSHGSHHSPQSLPLELFCYTSLYYIFTVTLRINMTLNAVIDLARIHYFHTIIHFNTILVLLFTNLPDNLHLHLCDQVPQ